MTHTRQQFSLSFLLCCCLLATASLASPAPTPEESTIIGIDLGTTYSAVGVYKDGRFQIIANDMGSRITPSYVAFDADGSRLVGDAAKNQASLNPTNTIFDIKRLIGRGFSDTTVQQDAKLLPYSIIKHHGKPYVQIQTDAGEQRYTPEEISAMVLGKMKTTAETFLGHPVHKAVITVPAYFNDAQRQATKDAGTIAGLEVVRIINEPTAAALAYGLNTKTSGKNVLVYDLGGGTFDVSVLSIDDGLFEVLATNGDTHLGGEDFDQRVMKFFLKQIQRQHGLDLRGDARALAKLRREVESAKRALSSTTQTKLFVEGLIKGTDWSADFTRARFEELNGDLFKQTMGPVAKVLKDSQLRKQDIDEIVLVGGSTRIPKVQRLLTDYFNGKAPNHGVNPDEAVARGAAVQAAILSGVAKEQTDRWLLVDVTPLSVGIETAGGVMAVMVERNSVIPTKKSKVFSTFQDNQHVVLIQVFQGERAMTKDNVYLGKFEITGIAPAPRGVPQIEVTFKIDANGVLHVSAEDKATRKSESITITADKGRLSEEEIDRMVRDAEEFAEADKLARQTVDARNALEGYAFNMRNSIQDQLKGKLADDDKDTIETAVNEVIEWLEDHPEAAKEDYDDKLHEVEAICNPIVSEIYQANGMDDEEDFDDNFDEL